MISLSPEVWDNILNFFARFFSQEPGILAGDGEVLRQMGRAGKDIDFENSNA